MSPGRGYDAVVVGAGIIGAACAYFLARAGLTVAVVERGTVASGTTGAGEGNILVSDKEPGPELELALLSTRLWRELADDLGPGAELELKGGLVVAAGPAERAALDRFAAAQAAAGVQTEPAAEDLRALEPHLAAGLARGVRYPGDMQVQPMMAAARLLRRARDLGAELCFRQEVTGLQAAAGRVTGVRTSRGVLRAGLVVNAAGPWAGELAQRAGLPLPVLPRRGFIVVTEPLPRLIRHKVYTADYVANVASGSAGLEISTVIEATASGTVLIGASRERVGFDRSPSLRVVGMLAARAAALFPVLAEARAIRFYRGFRPYCPDHLPVIGADRRLAGLLHACGHEGAGVGLAPATGHLIAALATGQAPALSVAPFDPNRFEEPPVPEPAVGPPAGRPPARRSVAITVDGADWSVPAGISIAAAFTQHGPPGWRLTRRRAELRGLACGIGVCFDCLVTVNGVPGVRACVAETRPGDVISTEKGSGFAGRAV